MVVPRNAYEVTLRVFINGKLIYTSTVIELFTWKIVGELKSRNITDPEILSKVAGMQHEEIYKMIFF